MNPQGTPTWPETGSEAIVPDPVRATTLSDIQAAQDTISTTGCGPEDYNTCTESFEAAREECRDWSCSDRLALMWEVHEENTDTLWDVFALSVATTNEQLLNWSETEFSQAIDSFITTFWGENGSNTMKAKLTYMWLSTIISDSSILEQAVLDLNELKNSNAAREVKLLHLSTINTTILIALWAPNSVVQAQEVLVWDLLSKVLESGNWELALEFINTQNWEWEELWEMYSDEVIAQLAEMTVDLDIGIIENNALRERILEHRREKAWTEIITQFSILYDENDEIMSLLGPIIETAVNWVGYEFNWEWVNDIISRQNEAAWIHWKQFPLIDWEVKTLLESSIQSLYDSQLAAAWFTESLSTLEDIRARAEEKTREMDRLVQTLIWTTDTDRIAEINREISALRFESFLIDRDIAQAQLTADIAASEAGESVEESENSVEDLNRLQWFLSNMSYDFDNPRVVEYFDESPEKIGLISDKNELIKYLDNTEKTISLGQINRNHRWDLDILSKIRQISEYELYLIPESYFEMNEENSWYHNISVLLKNSWANAGDVLQRFQSVNPWSEERLAEACFFLLWDQNINEVDKNNIKLHIENSLIIAFFTQERREQYGLEMNIETDPDLALDIFQTTFSQMIRRGNNPSDWDQEIYKKYLDLFWCSEIKSQFSSLINNDNIELNTLKVAIASLEYNPEYLIDGNIVTNGIEQRWLAFLRLLRSEYKNNPRVIKKWIESCGSWYEKNQFISMLEIDSPSELTALYEWLWSDISILRELFWNHITTEEIESIDRQIDPRWESHESRTAKFIVDSIKEKQVEEEQIRKTYLDQIVDYKQVEEDGKIESYHEKIAIILEEEWIDINLIKEWDLESYLSWDLLAEAEIYSQVLSQVWSSSIRALEVMRRLSSIKIEELDARIPLNEKK